MMEAMRDAFDDREPGGSCFMRGVLTPVILVFCLAMPPLVPQWTPVGIVIMVVLELVCVAFLIGLWTPARVSRIAFRVVSAVVFLAFVAYLVDEIRYGNLRTIPRSRGQSSPLNAILGMIVIGLPSLWYTLFGRLTLRPPPEEHAPGETSPDEVSTLEEGADDLDGGIHDVDANVDIEAWGEPLAASWEAGGHDVSHDDDQDQDNRG